jgi:hypothetical protein
MAHSTLVVGQRACDPPTHFWLIHNDLFWQITEQDSAYLIDSPCVPHSPDRRALKVGVSGYERHRSADDMYRTDVRSIVHCAHVGGFCISPQKGARYEIEWNVVRMSTAAPALSLRAASSCTISAPDGMRLFASRSRKRSHVGYSRSTFGVLTSLDEQMSRSFVHRVANKNAIVTLLHFLGRYAKTPIMPAHFIGHQPSHPRMQRHGAATWCSV